jgi:hypothetical protein
MRLVRKVDRLRMAVDTVGNDTPVWTIHRSLDGTVTELYWLSSLHLLLVGLCLPDGSLDGLNMVAAVHFARWGTTQRRRDCRLDVASHVEGCRGGGSM